MKILKTTLIALGTLMVISAVMIYIIYGGGSPYPDVSTQPLYPADSLHTVFSYDEPVGNLAVSPDNRLFFTVHPESRPGHFKVLEVIDGQAVPYPDSVAQFNHFNTVLGMVIDRQNKLWTIDHGNHGWDTVRISAFDLTTDRMVYDHAFSGDIAPLGSFYNDLQVSDNGQYVYIADVSFFGKDPALVVHNTQTGKSRRFLETHQSVTPQDWIVRNPIKEMTFFWGLVALKPGIDGLVLNKNNSYIYYAAMAHDGLYRIPTAVINNLNSAGQKIEKSVQKIGQKPLSDGLSIDSLDRIYITDVEHQGLARMDTSGQLNTIIRHPDIRWADGASFGGDGYLYFTDSAIPDIMLRSKKHIRNSAPYHIYRIKPDIAGIPGR